MPNSWTQERARLAVTIRHHPDDADLIAAARRDLKAARAADYVARLVAEAPELTSEQRDRLAAILRAPASTGAAA